MQNIQLRVKKNLVDFPKDVQKGDILEAGTLVRNGVAGIPHSWWGSSRQVAGLSLV